MKSILSALVLSASLIPASAMAADPLKEAAPSVPAPLPSADAPTEYSAAKILKKATFEKLPELFKTPQGDGTKAHEAVLDFYKEFEKKLEGIDDVPADLAEKAIDLLVKAMEAGPPSKTFFDSFMPMKPHAAPGFGGAFHVVVEVAIHRAEELHTRGNAASVARADKAVQAAWTLGRLMFEQGNRLPIKTMGLSILTSAGTPLYSWSPEETEAGKNITKWTEALNQLIEEQWRPKSDVVYSLRLKTPDMPATIGDLLNIARNDEDIAWRVEAVLSLGRAKLMPGRGAGNDAAIKAAIQEFRKSDNPRIAEAAKAADEFTKENVRDLQ